MSRAAFIENVARKGNMNKAEAKRTVDLVLGEIEAGSRSRRRRAATRLATSAPSPSPGARRARAATRRPGSRSESRLPRC